MFWESKSELIVANLTQNGDEQEFLMVDFHAAKGRGSSSAFWGIRESDLWDLLYLLRNVLQKLIVYDNVRAWGR